MRFFWKYIFPLLFGLLIYTSIRLVNDTTSHSKFWQRPWYTTAIEIAGVFVIGYMAPCLMHYQIKKWNEHPGRPISVKNIFREFAIVYFSFFVLLYR